MSEAKRKHVATGKPRGGARANAGRKPGSKNALPLGAVSAVRALRLRVPEGTSPVAAELAGEAFERIVKVMREQVSSFQAGNVLKAATLVRQEVCGPVPTKVDVGGALQVHLEINTGGKPKE